MGHATCLRIYNRNVYKWYFVVKISFIDGKISQKKVYVILYTINNSIYKV